MDDILERARKPRTPRDLLRFAHWAYYRWGPTLKPRHVARCAVAASRAALAARSYRLLDEQELVASRRSDTVFVFGTGRSLLDISAEEWARIGHEQTIAFGEFHRQQRVHVDYHLVNEVGDPGAYGASLRENPFYADTILVVQRGWLAYRGNEMIGRRLLPPGARVFRYRRVGRWDYAQPTTALRDGLAHGFNSSFDAVNLALLLGWRRVVLTGVDLYDRRYFHLGADETQPDSDRFAAGAEARFRGADHIVELYRRWRAHAESLGVELLVHNPRSLVAEALDVFSWEHA
jgi:hypothetical protein